MCVNVPHLHHQLQRVAFGYHINMKGSIGDLSFGISHPHYFIKMVPFTRQTQNYVIYSTCNT